MSQIRAARRRLAKAKSRSSRSHVDRFPDAPEVFDFAQAMGLPFESAAMRREIVRRLPCEAGHGKFRFWVLGILERIGIDGITDDLAELASDCAQPIWARALAFGIVDRGAPRVGARLMSTFDADDVRAIAVELVADTAYNALFESSSRDVVVDALDLGRGISDGQLELLETARKLADVPAPVFYRRALADPRLDFLHERWLAQVEDSALDLGVHVLEHLRDKARDDEEERFWQRSVLRLATRAACVPARAPSDASRFWLRDCPECGKTVISFCRTTRPGATLCVVSHDDQGFDFASVGAMARESDLERELSLCPRAHLEEVPPQRALDALLEADRRGRTSNLRSIGLQLSAAMLIEQAARARV